ncbi:aminotransferase class V-fold PLP-dependent enzyme [Scytonema sp. UIC 10036]|uniref:serine hydroxymethyltransferase n=1 Tax=Scytonema sp. UIC 10036 TaxID=2304196 RepID=UPI0012DAED4A|nr:serine hydroxymethyltransferase [Scytonema sp. UIC 10036]MUG92151.1 aminotransferase class V-fold PLP-dependent enzyme [Scytonema sp. UIC 10036]
MSEIILEQFMRRGIELLYKDDPGIYELLEQEYYRQTDTLTMVAASSIADPSVLVCEGMVTGNVTTEGYPGARFHAGCEFADEIERLAIKRAKEAFNAQYANVQPHSGTSANEIVIFSLLKPGDNILGLKLSSGGHLTHGAKVSVVGKYFNAIGYGLNQEGFIDYDQVHKLAQEFRPKLIISGASSYPRTIDFKRFREIADEVGAFLLADISHIAGLVVAGEHPSPIDFAHFVTTSTYKQLYGPRGGLILIGKDYDSLVPNGKSTLSEMIQKAAFPFFQGTPNLSAIAAKARALSIVTTPEFQKLAKRIVTNAQVLADCFIERGYKVLTGGTDNHIVLIDILANGITGVIAERALEECNIIVNKNVIPGDKKNATVTSGLRLGTNSLALRQMTSNEMPICVDLMDKVLSSVNVYGEYNYDLKKVIKEIVQDNVKKLCRQFPIPCYSIPKSLVR